MPEKARGDRQQYPRHKPKGKHEHQNRHPGIGVNYMAQQPGHDENDEIDESENPNGCTATKGIDMANEKCQDQSLKQRSPLTKIDHKRHQEIPMVKGFWENRLERSPSENQRRHKQHDEDRIQAIQQSSMARLQEKQETPLLIERYRQHFSP